MSGKRFVFIDICKNSETKFIEKRAAPLLSRKASFLLPLWWCGRVVKMQCFESCEVYARRLESRRWNHKPTVNSVVHPSEVGK